MYIQKRFNSVKNPPQQNSPFSFLYIIYTDLDQLKINYDYEKENPFADKLHKVLAGEVRERTSRTT
jgi:hypothetical protein